MAHRPSQFLDLPYAERRIIVVAADEVAEADRKATASTQAKDEGADWSKVTGATLKLLTGQTWALADVAVEAIKAWNRARESGLGVLTVGRSEAKAIRFPPGHPRDETLYVGHPAVANIYHTPAAFHRLCFEHKFCEAVQLLMALGATKIAVEHVSGWAKEFSANLTVPLANSGGEVGAKAGAAAKTGSSLLYQAKLAPTGKPKIPKGLVWYPHEPTWQQIASGRQKFGLKTFSLSVRYEDDFGINAGFKVAVAKAGFDLGGSFEEHQSTIWRIDGEF